MIDSSSQTLNGIGAIVEEPAGNTKNGSDAMPVWKMLPKHSTKNFLSASPSFARV